MLAASQKNNKQDKIGRVDSKIFFFAPMIICKKKCDHQWRSLDNAVILSSSWPVSLFKTHNI